jgi:hypothetical protein
MTLHRRITRTPVEDELKGTKHEWALLGSAGAITATFFERRGLDRRLAFSVSEWTPDGSAWFGYGIDKHSPTQLYDFAPTPSSNCHLLEGPCWTDGSSLQAHELLQEWIAAGRDDEVIWVTLEDRYRSWFGVRDEDGAA